MTLDDFLHEQRCLLGQFEQYWLQKNAEKPDEFPLEIDAGSWDEMLTLYSDENS